MFKIVNVREFFNINRVISLKFLLKSLILLLILRLHILDSLQSFFGSFDFLLSSLQLVEQLSLVQSELFHRFFHLGHLFGLVSNDVADAFFDVDLLGVSVKVSRNRVQELKSLVTVFF